MAKQDGQEKVAIGADHAGFDLKEKILSYLKSKNVSVTDFGTDSTESTDYPDYASKVASSVSTGESTRGILVCGTGIGMSMVANRYPNVRAALCASRETAEISRLHNNSNVLCLGSRKELDDSFEEIIDAWLSTEFEGGRHERRVSKIHKITGV